MQLLPDLGVRQPFEVLEAHDLLLVVGQLRHCTVFRIDVAKHAPPRPEPTCCWSSF